MKTSVTLLTAIGLAVTAAPAIAASVTFTQFATTTDNPVIDTAPTVTVDDDDADVLTFHISIPNANGLLSGVFVNLAGDPDVEADDLNSLTPNVDIIDFATDTKDIGNGRNLNGGFGPPVNAELDPFTFAFGFEDDDQGGASRQIAPPFNFTLDDLGGALDVASVQAVGLRFQSVGELGQDGLGGGSEKLVSAIPLPAAAWMLVSALGGLGMAGWRSRRAA